MKRSSLGVWVIVGFLLAFSVFSPPMANAADTYFPTPGGGGVNGAVGMSLNASGQAVPSSDPTALSSPVTPAPTAGQGCTPYHLSGGTAASTNSTSVKAAAAGTVCRWTLINTNASTIGYLKVYDSAAAPTCSSATGLKHVYPILAGPGGVQTIDAMGEAYVSGIGFCVTGGGGNTDNSNAATGIYIEGSYK